jgi:hypothetical protein
MKGLAAVTCIAIPLAALAAGCGSSGPTQTTNVGSSKSPEQAAFAYADCMREHGVPSFPDPQVVTTGGAGGGSVGIRQALPASAAASPKFKSATKACARILPAPSSNGPGGQQGPSKQDLLAFARCIRNHGISGFPDPSAAGRLNLQTISAAGVDVHSRSFEVAADSCVSVTHGAITAAAVAALVNGSH